MKGSTASSTPRAAPGRTAANAAPQPRSVDRFRLTGPSLHRDPRITAARRDIADIALAGTLFAPHYVRPLRRLCGRAAAMLHATPSPDAAAVSQLLPGEPFAVLEVVDVWCWGYGAIDGYVGYVAAAALAGPAADATHIVSAPSTLLFAQPDIKTPLPLVLPIGSRLAGRMDDEGAFLALADGGFVPARHVVPVGTFAADPVAVACTLVGMPYLWGGRGGGGIDCSGLVQQALALCGVAAPRDSDQQRDGLGTLLADDEPLRRGDLVFFPGHVGLMVDVGDIVHANAHGMAVTVEPLAAVVARLAAAHPHPILARRRLP